MGPQDRQVYSDPNAGACDGGRYAARRSLSSLSFQGNVRKSYHNLCIGQPRSKANIHAGPWSFHHIRPSIKGKVAGGAAHHQTLVLRTHTPFTPSARSLASPHIHRGRGRLQHPPELVGQQPQHALPSPFSHRAQCLSAIFWDLSPLCECECYGRVLVVACLRPSFAVDCAGGPPATRSCIPFTVQVVMRVTYPWRSDEQPTCWNSSLTARCLAAPSPSRLHVSHSRGYTTTSTTTIISRFSSHQPKKTRRCLPPWCCQEAEFKWGRTASSFQAGVAVAAVTRVRHASLLFQAGYAYTNRQTGDERPLVRRHSAAACPVIRALSRTTGPRQ
ncbi:hypothetical protein GE09DRAFT_425501 [Coniochaeta sp. 2T2.1]|nr:hypothetical protein GE09DRAFT_425501 [Coniochaeta sp. 2T2.1]